MGAPRAAAALWSLRLALLAGGFVRAPAEADAATAAPAPAQPGEGGLVRWAGAASCECCEAAGGVRLRARYRDTIEKYCGGGASTGAEPERVMVQTSAGLLTVDDAARGRVCASPLCRSAIVSFWEPVRECSSIAYWRNVALAWMTAKAQCAQGIQEGPHDGEQWLAVMGAAFRGAGTGSDQAMRAAEAKIHAATLASLQAGAGIEAGEQLKVLCERVGEQDVEPLDGEGGDEGAVEGESGGKKCPQVSTVWPARGEEAVRLELGYVVLRFDQCVMAAGSNLSLELKSSMPGATLLPVPSGADGTMLVFPIGGGEQLTSGARYSLRLPAQAVKSCVSQEPLCKDFRSTFTTLATSPKVVRTELVQDRWLRTTFNMPVEASGITQGLRLTVQRAQEPGEEPPDGEGLKGYFPLTPSTHLVWVDEEWGSYIGAKALRKGGIVSSDDGTGLLGSKRLRCAYAEAPPEDAPRCQDLRTFEVDLCAQEGFCDAGSGKIACGMEVEARYPKALALRTGGGQPSAAGRGVGSSRACAPPSLEPSMEWQQKDGTVLFKWSEPVKLESAWKKVWFCEMDTPARRCLLSAAALEAGAVKPCADEGCRTWTLDLAATNATLPECGRVELRVEAGAVRSAATGKRNALGHTTLELPSACPVFQEANRSECWLVRDAALRRRGADNDNLEADLASQGVAIRGVGRADELWARLAARTFMPACVVFPGLVLNSTVAGLHTHALFEYVRLGGQLYFVGGGANVQALQDVSGLKMTPGVSGNHQLLAKKLPFEIPSDNDSSSSSGFPPQLPVLNQVAGVRLSRMGGSRGGARVTAHGVYAGRQESAEQANGFGVLEVQAGKGLMEYIGFDWHEGKAELRKPWARLLAQLLAVNRGRGALGGEAPAEGRRLSSETGSACAWLVTDDGAGGGAAGRPDGALLRCSFAYRCASPLRCDAARGGLLGAVAEPSSALYGGAAANCLPNLSAQSYSVPNLIQLVSPCPSRPVLAAKVTKLNAACGFFPEGAPPGPGRFANDTSYLEARLAEAAGGGAGAPEASFGPEVRSRVCRRPLCRGAIDELLSLLAPCPGGAEGRGRETRRVRGLGAASGSCARAPLGEAEPYTVQADAVVRGVNTISNEELEALRGHMFEGIADALGFSRGGRNDLSHAAAAFGHASQVTGPGYSTADLRVSVQVQPAAVGDAGAPAQRLGSLDDAPVTQKSMAFVPVGLEGGSCSGCTVPNLQMLSVQPGWNASDVDPASEIHVTFQDFVEKVPHQGARIRIFPTALRPLCERPDTQFLYYPTDTGPGDGTAAVDPSADTLGVPGPFVCQEYEVGDEVSVQVNGETLKIKPEHPLMRNTQYTVLIPPWTIRGSVVGARADAMWLGWPNDDSAGDKEYTFTTGAPAASSAARALVTVGCGAEAECDVRRVQLDREVDGVLAGVPCFLDWFRCQADRSSPRLCASPPGGGCNPEASTWQEASVESEDVADGSQLLGHARLAAHGEPVRAKLLREPLSCPWWVWLHAGLCLCSAACAVFRAAAWACDAYRESREFDPYVCQTTRPLPYKCALVALLAPLVAGCAGVAVAVPAFWGMVGPLREIPLNPHLDSYVIAKHLNQQVEHAYAATVSCSAGVVAAMAFGVIARFKSMLSDRGQFLALISVVLACSAACGGASGWLAAAGADELRDAQAGFEVTVLSLVLSVVASVLLTVIAVPALAVLAFLQADGIGDVLRYYFRFVYMQLFYWRDAGKPVGCWSRWVLHLREVRGVHGFVDALRRRGHGDGLLSLRLYSTDNPTATVSTNSFSVRSTDEDSDVQSFEGSSMSISITDPFSVLVVDVMFQPQVGAQAERIASTVWDPWTKGILGKCFSNWPLCNPENSSQVLWNPRDLDEVDGSPKPDTYCEFSLDLTPAMGLLSFQATHLGPMKQMSDQGAAAGETGRVYPLGDTLVAFGGIFYRRSPIASPAVAFGYTAHTPAQQQQQQQPFPGGAAAASFGPPPGAPPPRPGGGPAGGPFGTRGFGGGAAGADAGSLAAMRSARSSGSPGAPAFMASRR